MDINEYMKTSLGLLERIAEGIEALNNDGISIVLPAGSELQAVGDVIRTTSKETAEAEKAERLEEANQAAREATQAQADNDAKVAAKKAADKKAADAKKVAAAEEAKAAAAEEAKATPEVEKVKRATADEARAALKAFAAVEGNGAAMELITGLGASSVSGLAEASTDEDDKLAQLIKACGV